MGNINQSVHLVGNHMADQHANCANLLILSNGVQLIPLAAFIQPSHTGGKRVKKKKKKRKEFRMIFIHPLKSVLLSFSVFFGQRSPTLVMNEVDTRASGSCCGSERGVTEGETRKSGEIRKSRGGDRSRDGINLDYNSAKIFARALKGKFKPKVILYLSSDLGVFIHLLTDKHP